MNQVLEAEMMSFLVDLKKSNDDLKKKMPEVGDTESFRFWETRTEHLMKRIEEERGEQWKQ
jgi:hypothetical protein